MDRIIVNKHIKFALKRARVRNSRSLFIILGPDGNKQIPVLCEVLHRGKAKDFTVLCCSSNVENLRDIKLNLKGSLKDEMKYKNMNTIFPKIIFKQYSDVQNAVHQSFNLAVLDDIEKAQPSNLAFITEAVKGGGVLLILFSKMKSLEDFSSRISSFTKSRFLKRLCASLIFKENSRLILDDELNIISLGKEECSLPELRKSDVAEELHKLKEENSDETTSALISLCQTAEQAKLLLKFLEALKNRSVHRFISVASPKGRGKSAALGLAIAGSLALNYSNVFISSYDYENVKIIFKFLFKGLDALNYKEDEDYDLIQSVNVKFNNALLGINMFRDHPQAVRFILPGDVENKLEQAELVIIDEASSIPLPLLKRLLGSYHVFMASTTNGYGGAGSSLYENVMREICQPIALKIEDKPISSVTFFPVTDKRLEKLTLSEPIYYSPGDDVEKWINYLLCLECSINVNLTHGCPEPQQCKLFYVCQEILFSYESHAEQFLQQLMSLFLCSKRTVSPDILLKIADDPDYHIFCLVSPFESAKATPEVLCAILVHTERQVPSNIVYSGAYQQDSLSDCFNEWKATSEECAEQDFLPRTGIHVVDIVTHPEYRKMGYGLRAVQLLQEYYDGKWVPLDDSPFLYSSRDKTYIGDEQQTKPPLLLQLSEVEPTKVEYFLVSYWLSPSLLKFWKKSAFVPVYISRDKNCAQEHLCLMMKSLDSEFEPYMQESWKYFCDYLSILLSAELKNLPSSLALNLLKSSCNLPRKELTKEEIDIHLNPRSMKSLEKYCQNLGELHSIVPCFPILTKLFFQNRFSGVVLPLLQEVILLAFGLQRNTAEEISKELGLPSTQVHGLLNRTVRKLTNYLSTIIEKAIEKSIKVPDVIMEPISQDLDEELKEAAEKIKLQQQKQCEELKDMDLSQYAIKGSEDDWEKALHSGRKTLVSIKSIKKAPENVELQDTKKTSYLKGKKNFKRKK